MDTGARCRFGRKHRHQQRNKAAWNACCLQLFDRQSLRLLARANLFDGRALERPLPVSRYQRVAPNGVPTNPPWVKPIASGFSTSAFATPKSITFTSRCDALV